VDELPIRTIAPGHGPAIAESWRSLLVDYRRWGATQERSKLSVALLFASAYGNTAAIADALAQGVARTGVRVESINCEFTPAEKLLEAIRQCDAVLIGSPTLGGHAPTPIVSALGTLLAEGDRSKPVGVRQLRLERGGPRPAREQVAGWRLPLRLCAHQGEIQP